MHWCGDAVMLCSEPLIDSTFGDFFRLTFNVDFGRVVNRLSMWRMSTQRQTLARIACVLFIYCDSKQWMQRIEYFSAECLLFFLTFSCRPMIFEAQHEFRWELALAVYYGLKYRRQTKLLWTHFPRDFEFLFIRFVWFAGVCHRMPSTSPIVTKRTYISSKSWDFFLFLSETTFAIVMSLHNSR